MSILPFRPKEPRMVNTQMIKQENEKLNKIIKIKTNLKTCKIQTLFEVVAYSPAFNCQESPNSLMR